MVGLAGLAPAIPCSQGRCVGYYATARNSCQATGCIRSPVGADHSLAREVAGTKIGPHGTICMRTGPVLSRMPLLLGYAGDGATPGTCALLCRLRIGRIAFYACAAIRTSPWRDSHPHFSDFKSDASSVGLHGGNRRKAEGMLPMPVVRHDLISNESRFARSVHLPVVSTQGLAP